MSGLRKLWVYLFPPNDWILKEAEDDECVVDYLTDGIYEYTGKKYRNYYIYYSKYRNKYKLNCTGFKCTEGYMYNHMLNKVIRLNNQIEEK